MEVDVRKQVASLAQGMLNGDIHYLKGAIEIAELRDALGAYANDPDFVVFAAIMAEIDELPLGRDVSRWTESAMKRYQTEIDESLAWAKSISMTQCRSIAIRFGR